MKTRRLDGRFKANQKWGYLYRIEFGARDWQKYFQMKKQASSMLGESEDTTRYLWRASMQMLKTAPWAYQFDRSHKPSYIYFRTEKDMEQCLMMWILSGHA